jgi:hypothetical protein
MPANAASSSLAKELGPRFRGDERIHIDQLLFFDCAISAST